MSLGKDPFYYIRVLLTVLTDDKKRRLNILLFKDIQNFRCPDRIWAVIECQGNLADLVAGSLDDI